MQMLASMKNRILSNGLKKIEAKINVFYILDVLKRMSSISGTLGIEPRKSDSPSNPCSLSDTLKELCLSNAEYFRTDDTENGQRLRVALLGRITLLLSLVFL